MANNLQKWLFLSTPVDTAVRVNYLSQKTEGMKVLILGSGGREHAMAWKISQSSLVSHLFIAPGNPGTSGHGINISIDVMDFKGVADFCSEHEVDMVIVGPEAPLAGGIRDFLESDRRLSKLIIVGPGKEGARLESSKDMAKAFMMRHGIPTARYGSFDRSTVNEALAFLDEMKGPYVIKADGLAAGKGVIIAERLDEAKEAVRDMLERERFGSAGHTVVIEEFLKGTELSVFVLTDGKEYKLLPEAKDYKRVGEGDTGPNTGGMGAVSPVPFADAVFMDKVEDRIIKPTVRGLEKDGIPYTGFIFFGLMAVGDNPYVIEYNVRMGDPETEVVMPRIKSDLADLLSGLGDGTFSESDLVTEERFATTVMLVSGGYPGSYEKGKRMEGLDRMQGCVGFHAGTRREEDRIYTDGGRVISLTALGKTLEQALDICYENAEVVNFEGKYFRKDIGQDLM
jgi:phosphoribosylamine--glycine ligase